MRITRVTRCVHSNLVSQLLVNVLEDQNQIALELVEGPDAALEPVEGQDDDLEPVEGPDDALEPVEGPEDDLEPVEGPGEDALFFVEGPDAYCCCCQQCNQIKAGQERKQESRKGRN